MIKTIWAKLQRVTIAVLVWSATPPPERNDREAIWSVPHDLRHVYFVILSILWWPEFAEKFAEQSFDFQPNKWQTITELWQTTTSTLQIHGPDLAAYGIASAILTLILTQTGAYIMVPYQSMLNRWVRPVIAKHEARGKAQGISIGKAEGKAEGISIGEAQGISIGEARQNQLWQDWLSRRTQAEKEGITFEEPPPGINGHNSKG